ncbi:hypothetical protein UQW22_07575 [Isoptericola halotolerans]|uniref:hypothetical protein n=1 Tax=Isoptericola halotolerans TaxID=300560 RepID=UPI00388D2E89
MTTDTTRGTLGLDPSWTAQIQFVRHLPVPTERAWAWLTDPELLERWLPGCRAAASSRMSGRSRVRLR